MIHSGPTRVESGMETPPATTCYGPIPERWTRLTLSDSEYGEVSVMVRDSDLSLPSVMEELVIPCLTAKGYVNVAKWLERLDEASQR